jgi:hypothetical protein
MPNFTISGNRVKTAIEVSIQELQFEANALLEKALLEKSKLEATGLSKRQATKQIIDQVTGGQEFAKTWNNHVDSIVGEMGKQLVAKPVNLYGEAHPTQNFAWILGSVKTHHCPDCLRLSNMEPRTIAEWEKIGLGLPREGRTACNVGCKCMLTPTNTKPKQEKPKPIPVNQSASYKRAVKNNSFGKASATQGDSYLADRAKEIGYTGKPEVVPQKQFDSVKGDNLLRGVGTAKFGEDFKTGKYYAGTGIFGNGTYTATDIKVARNFAGRGKHDTTGSGGAILQMKLKPTAKTISLYDIETESKKRVRSNNDKIDALKKDRRKAQRSDLPDSEVDKIYTDLTKQVSELEMLNKVYRDPSYMAMELGYDAVIHNRGSDGEYYAVILNRSAVIVSEVSL